MFFINLHLVLLTAVYQSDDNIVTVTGTVLGYSKPDVPRFKVWLSNKPTAQALPQPAAASATATKRLENGMLLIDNNGKTFNMTGIWLR